MKKYIVIFLIVALIFVPLFEGLRLDKENYERKAYFLAGSYRGVEYDQDSVPAFDTPLILYVNGEYVSPYCELVYEWSRNSDRSWRKSSEGTYDEWEFYAKSEYNPNVSQYPTITLNDDFVIYCNDGFSATVWAVYGEIYGENYNFVSRGLDILNDINAFQKSGTYYLSILIHERGDYVYRLWGTKGYEIKEYECVYKIVVE